MQMEEMQRERRAKEQLLMMMAMQHSGHNPIQSEEERMLQQAIEESKSASPADPNSPDVDNMTYE